MQNALQKCRGQAQEGAETQTLPRDVDDLSGGPTTLMAPPTDERLYARSMTRGEEAKMIPQNARPASSSTNQKAGRASRPAVSGRTLSASDSRRATYTPNRPAGVHSRELGIKKA